MKTAVLAIFLATFSVPASAQTAPDVSQAAAYQGLHRAVYDHDLGAVERLIAAGADLDARDAAGRTPLHVAAFQSNVAALQRLVAAGANLDALEHQAYDIVTIAAVANDLEFLDAALALGADPGQITSPYTGTALIAAAHLGHYQVAQSLIDAGAPLDHINNLEWNALIEAVILGDGGPDHAATVAALLRAGADPSIGDAAGITPLEHARQRGYSAIVLLF